MNIAYTYNVDQYSNRVNKKIMAQKTRLTQTERTFFELVNQAVLANPFSAHRADIDAGIARMFPGTSHETAIETAVAEVKRQINRLENEDRASLDRFSGKDCRIMETAFLFDFFYRYLADFDRLIKDQVHAGDTPVKAAFHQEALGMLEKRGFDRETALQLFALCYQLRRAFYFIHNGIIGDSGCMTKLRESLWNNVFTHNLDLYHRHLWSRMEDFSTLLLGETGTGKGAAASAIGRSGFIPFDPARQCFAESFSSTFTAVNLSQFSESLIESELFGHKKGAFTGAVADHKGILDRCSANGAVFLDEIGEVSIPIQIKLLKVLEERSFSPVGSHETRRFEGRIIAATNRSIEKLRNRNRMRDDFYYRLCSDIIVVPTLRQRIRENPGELDTLVAHSVERILGTPSRKITKDLCRRVRQVAKNHPWPGNVRELAQCIRRLLLKKTDDRPSSADSSGAPDALATTMNRGEINAQQLVSKYCRKLYERFGTYGEVARRAGLDRRTVKKYIHEKE